MWSDNYTNMASVMDSSKTLSENKYFVDMEIVLQMKGDLQ